MRKAKLILSIIRREKLFYYAVVEHLRSNDSYAAWVEAHSTLLNFAQPHEVWAKLGKAPNPNSSPSPNPNPNPVPVIPSPALALVLSLLAQVRELAEEFGGPEVRRDPVRIPTDVKADEAALTDAEITKVRNGIEEDSQLMSDIANARSHIGMVQSELDKNRSRRRRMSATALATSPLVSAAGAGGAVAAGAARGISRRASLGLRPSIDALTPCGSTKDLGQNGEGARSEPSRNARLCDERPISEERSSQQSSPIGRTLTRKSTMQELDAADFQTKDPTSSKPM